MTPRRSARTLLYPSLLLARALCRPAVVSEQAATTSLPLLPTRPLANVHDSILTTIGKTPIVKLSERLAPEGVEVMHAAARTWTCALPYPFH